MIDNQELITINNPDTSEVVQTQLVLTDDGSVVYRVANIPDGILATEMNKLDLLVVNNGDCCGTERWSAEMNSGTNDTLENSEPPISDSKTEQGNSSSAALPLLSSLESENQAQENQNSQESNDGMNQKDITQKEKESTGRFACDICCKTFGKSAYLYRHLRKHTGEFTCVNCLAVSTPIFATMWKFYRY